MNVSFRDVCFRYPGNVLALRDVTIDLDSGEAVALVGENGAGKTTLAKHLNGLLKPTSGQVMIGDWDTQEKSVALLSQRVGFVFQNPDDQLFARTVASEIAFGPTNLGWDKETIEAAVEGTLAKLGLSALGHKHPYDLHISQRKLVAMAAVLAMQTPIMVLDEPTIGQDSGGVRCIGDLVESLKEEGRTVIAISHDIDFCAEHFDRAIVMSAGTIMADGPGPEILTDNALLARAQVEAPQLSRLAAQLNLPARPHEVGDFLHLWRTSRRPGAE